MWICACFGALQGSFFQAPSISFRSACHLERPILKKFKTELMTRLADPGRASSLQQLAVRLARLGSRNVAAEVADKLSDSAMASFSSMSYHARRDK